MIAKDDNPIKFERTLDIPYDLKVSAMVPNFWEREECYRKIIYKPGIKILKKVYEL